MDLFQSSENLLPFDGFVTYKAGLLSLSESKELMDYLMEEIDWRQEKLILFGKPIQMRRKIAWLGDKPFKYKYGGSIKTASLWPKGLLNLKEKVELSSNSKFNSCLLNLYFDGDDGMGWHSDNEKELIKNSTIASVSLGATRPFKFKHNSTGDQIKITLESGSLLLMEGETQQFWKHALPKTKKSKTPRVNLTFRLFDEQNTNL